MANFNGTSGNDRFLGTRRNDIFRMERGGDDVVFGSKGTDQFFFGASLTSLDQINGGRGGDSVEISGQYSSAVHILKDQMIDVESLSYDASFDYTISLDDQFNGNNSGANFRVGPSYSSIDDLGRLTFDGSAIRSNDLSVYGADGDDVLTGGRLSDFLYGRGGDDMLIGGKGDDLIWGGTGADTLTGGFGADRFGYDYSDLGTPLIFDTITDFRDGNRIDLSYIDVDFHIGATGGRTGAILAHYSRATDETTVRIFTDRDNDADLVIQMSGNHAHLTPADFIFHG